MKPVFRFAPVLLTALLASASLGAPRPLFSPSPLATFDGTRWSGLALGQTTFKDIRARFDTGGGIYDRSTQLTMPKNSGLRVYCLWAKRGDDEVLTSVVLRYSGVTPSSDQLEAAFDPGAKQGQALYQRGRYEDWRVVRFPQRGVSAFQLRDGGNYTTPILVLSAPGSLASLSQQLVDEETAVEERIDPMENEPKVGEFGEITIDFDGNETDDIPTWVRSDTRDTLRDVSAGGTLRWNRGAAGYYRMRVSASRDKKDEGGTYSVSTEIDAAGPYGTIHTTGSGSQRWKRDDDDYPRTPAAAFDRAVREARRDAETKYQQAMVISGPPSLGAIREDQWTELVTLLRSPQNSAPVDTGTGTGTGAPVLGF
ncbi:hypothetical protein IAD21_00078 [Abditibacteriota bacterium]|nr:hypothetical protein IAD21_00078 [Abditibacteriota bacterium]